METFAEYTNIRFCVTIDPETWKETSRYGRWYNTCAAKLYVFLGIVVYVSSHFEGKINKFWARLLASCPSHPLRGYMGCDCFRLLFRFFYTWCPVLQRDADPFTRVDCLVAQI